MIAYGRPLAETNIDWPAIMIIGHGDVEACRLLDQFTARAEVIELVSKGLGSKEIAAALDVSVRTVDSHRASIAMKLGTPAVAEQTRIWLATHR